MNFSGEMLILFKDFQLTFFFLSVFRLLNYANFICYLLFCKTKIKSTQNLNSLILKIFANSCLVYCYSNLEKNKRFSKKKTNCFNFKINDKY